MSGPTLTGCSSGDASGVAVFVVHQSPDGAWYAEATHGEGRHTNLAGWDGLAGLLTEHRLAWQSPRAMSRFRAQFGEPPGHLDVQQIAAAPPA
jgi:hypothetical protein